MARPKKPATDLRSDTLGVRLTVSERQELDRAAAALGLTAAEFVRRRSLGYRLPAEVARQRHTTLLATALLRLGVNLNQIAHRLNAGGRETGTLLPLLARIRAELDKLDDPGADGRRPVV